MAALGLAAPLLRSVPKLYFVLFFTFQLLIGWLTACINVPLISYFQTRVPLEQQGRFFALLAFFSGILIPLASPIPESWPTGWVQARPMPATISVSLFWYFW